MRVFVTVGTTTFNRLIRDVDVLSQQFPEHEFICQLADGDCQPKHCHWFRFTQEIESEYQQSDVIITHAGAGSVYKLLEMGKTLVVVPNTERADQHQLDLAGYVKAQDYALVAENIEQLSGALRQIEKGYQPAPYKKEAFFKADEIKRFLDIQ